MRGRDEDDFTAFVIARQRTLQRAAWLLTGDWAAAGLRCAVLETTGIPE